MIYADSDPSVNWLNDWLVNYGIWIALGLAGVVFVMVLILFLISLKKRKDAPFLSENNEANDEFHTKLLEAIGGKENIVSGSLNGSRISLVLNDYEVINEKLLTECGVDSFIKMSNKITLVSKSNSDKIYKALNR